MKEYSDLNLIWITSIFLPLETFKHVKLGWGTTKNGQNWGSLVIFSEVLCQMIEIFSCHFIEPTSINTLKYKTFWYSMVNAHSMSGT